MGIAHAKLLLFGEHAVVQGYPALGLGLPLRLRAAYRGPAQDWSVEGLPPEFQEQVLGAVRHLIEAYPPDCSPGVLCFQSEIPPASGLGSSAALCSALVAQFYPELSPTEHWRRALHAENYFHGKSSGVDVALAMREGLWLFEPRSEGPLLTEVTCPPLALVIGSLRRRAEAKSLILDIHGRAQAKEGRVLSLLQFLGQSASRAAELLQRSPPAIEEVGRLATENQKILESLGLGHPSWEELQSTAIRAGTVGGKWSGAGGGGAFWFLYTDPGTARRAASKLRQARHIEWLLEPRELILE